MLQKYRIPCAVSSGSTRTEIAAILKSANLSHLLPIWFSGYDDVECGKPCPDVYLATAQAIGVQSQQCIVVEDTYTGMVAARAAGAFVIALSLSEKSEPSLDIADLKLTSFLDIFSLVKSILTERNL